MTEEDRKAEETLRRIVREEVTAALPQPKEPLRLASEGEDQWTHVHNCPACKQKLEQEKRDYMKEQLLKRANLQYECTGCGTGVEKNEKECPTCGNTKARKRR